jgi:hypothetical protein
MLHRQVCDLGYTLLNVTEDRILACTRPRTLVTGCAHVVSVGLNSLV